MTGEIKALLREKGRLTLRQIARHFEMEPEAIEPILKLLVDKGRLQAEQLCGGGCSGCACASAADLTLYTLANRELPVVD